jgi:hypothetical protein
VAAPVPKAVRTAKCGSARHVDDRRRTGQARDSQSRAIHLYVKDAHSTYQRALGAGATVLNELTDQPYRDRGRLRERCFRNHWYIATNRATGHSARWIRPCHFVAASQGSGEGHGFSEASLGRREVFRSASPEGVIHHAQVRIGNSMFESAKLMDSTSPCLLQFSHTYLMQPHPTSEHWTLAQLPCGPRPRCTAI